MTTGLGRGALRRIKYNVPDVSFQSKKMQAYRDDYTGRKKAERYRILRAQQSRLRNKREIKTVDHTFEAAYVAPYVVDQIAETRLNASTTGVLQALMVQQGVGTNQRIGNTLTMKSIRLRFRLAPTGFAELTNSMVRLMLVYDRQPNGAYPTTATILSNIDQAGTISAFDPDGDINVNNMDRFIVLMDEYHIVPAVDILTTSNFNLIGPTSKECFVIDRYIKLRGLEQKYSATSSPMVIANQTTGALYLFSMGSVATGGEPYCWHGKVRLRYFDM